MDTLLSTKLDVNMGRPPLRKKGAFTDTERKRRYRANLKRRQRDAGVCHVVGYGRTDCK